MFFRLLFVVLLVSADRGLKFGGKRGDDNDGATDPGFLFQTVNFPWQSDGNGYQHVWPEMRLDWRIILGTVIGFLGAAFGSVGGVGGGGIFVHMLSLIIGFDPKSSTAISKCMIMGAAASTVFYNLRLKHPHGLKFAS